jgi:hypothetical protein
VGNGRRGKLRVAERGEYEDAFLCDARLGLESSHSSPFIERDDSLGTVEGRFTFEPLGSVVSCLRWFRLDCIQISNTALIKKNVILDILKYIKKCQL